MKNAEPVNAVASIHRASVDLPGRLFMPADEREAHCQIVDLSPDEASVQCEIALECGTPVVLYVESLGRFEGTIATRDDNVFRVQFVCTVAKRQRTAEQLTLFLKEGPDGGSAPRRRQRSRQNGIVQFTRADGQIAQCEVIDISVSGVSLKTGIRPQIGEFVLIAQTAGRVLCYHEHGISIEFVGQAP
jgi:hypothetical protein